MQSDSSILGQTSEIALATSTDQDLRPSYIEQNTTPPFAPDSFLIVVNYLHSHSSIPTFGDVSSITHLETLGEGLSFTVKKTSGGRALTALENPVAYKISRIQSTFKESRHISDPRAEARKLQALLMELHVLTHDPIVAHPNIVRLIAFRWGIKGITEAIVPVLEVEYAEYGTLATFQKTQGTSLGYLAERRLCHDIGCGLQVLHACGVVHGDIKAENVLIFGHPGREYVAKLSDFGCAVVLASATSGKEEKDPLASLPGGTAPWRAPESNKPIPASQLPFTDIFSYTLLIWKTLLDGQDPFNMFDLPFGREARLQGIAVILSGNVLALSGLAISSIEKLHGDLPKEEVINLLQVFNHGLSRDPTSRNLDVIVSTLSDGDEPSKTTTSPPDRLKTLDKFAISDNEVSVDIWFVSTWALPVRRFLVSRLEHTCHTLSSLSPASRSMFARLEYDISFALFQCHLTGLGFSKPDPEKAFTYLLSASRLGRPSGVNNFKARASVLPFLIASGIEGIQDDSQMLRIIRDALSIAAVGGFRVWGLMRRFHPEALAHESVQHVRLLMLMRSHGITSEEVVDQLERGALIGIIEDLRKPEGYGEGVKVVDGIDIGNGNGLLHGVVLSCALEATALLLSLGADVNARNHWGETALLLACKVGYPELVRVLLENGADPAIQSRTGEVAAHWLVSFNREAIKEILAPLILDPPEVLDAYAVVTDPNEDLIGKDFVVDQLISGLPITRAVGRNHYPAVDAIVKAMEKAGKFANYEVACKYCENPIVLATILHQPTILRLLLSAVYQASPFAKDEDEGKTKFGETWRERGGHSLLHRFIGSRIDVERMVVHLSEWKSALKETLGVLNEFGFVTPLVYTRNSEEGTLTYAVTTGSDEMVEALLELDSVKALLNTPSPHGYTPIHTSLRRSNLFAFRKLVEMGANLDLRGRYQAGDALAPSQAHYLHVCASTRVIDMEFPETILRAGVPAGLVDLNGTSPLKLALMRGSFALAELLMKEGESVNKFEYDDDGFNLFGELLRVKFGRNMDDVSEVTRFCLNVQAPFERPNFLVNIKHNVSAIHAAAFNSAIPMQSKETMDLLIAAFPAPEQINARTDDGYTALHLAIEYQNLPAVKALLAAGADVTIPLVDGRSCFQYAKDHARRVEDEAQPNPWLHCSETDTDRGLEIVYLIDVSNNWSEEDGMRGSIARLHANLAPCIQVLQRVSHTESKVLKMQAKVVEIVSRENEILASSMTSFREWVEFEKQLNRLLHPWFFSELLVKVLPAGYTGMEDSKASVRLLQERVPWLGYLNDLQVMELQQAAAFDFLLHQLDTDEDLEGEVDSMYSPLTLQKYAKSGNEKDLPVTTKFVRYPFGLLSFYYGIFQPGSQLLQATIPAGSDLGWLDELIDHYKFLQARARARRSKFAARQASTKPPLSTSATDDELETTPPIIPESNDNFKKFHFDLLQPTPLTSYKQLELRFIGTTVCSCNRGAYGKFTLAQLSSLSDGVDALDNGDEEVVHEVERLLASDWDNRE